MSIKSNIKSKNKKSYNEKISKKLRYALLDEDEKTFPYHVHDYLCRSMIYL